MGVVERPAAPNRRAAREGAGADVVTATSGRRAAWAGPTTFVAVGLAYLLLAQYGRWLDQTVDLGGGIWTAAGVATAALLLVPTRRWGWVVAAIGAGGLGGDLASGYPPAAALWFTVGHCAGPLVGAALVRRLVHHRGALVPVLNLIGFLLLGAGVGPLVGATVGLAGWAAVGEPLLQAWPQQFISQALGVLTVAPALLAIRAGHPRRRPLEAGTLIGGVVAVSLSSPLLFPNLAGSPDITLAFPVVLLTLWAALRFGMRGAAWMALWVSQRAVLATAFGYGPFALAGADPAVTLLQLFVLIATVLVLFLAALVSDLSGRDGVESALQREAHHDSLTGLPNRTALRGHLERALARSDGRGGGVAVLVCDLDGFKVINDGLGHQAGDQVLVEVARRLQASVRPSDVVARLSGDEFVVIAEDADDQAIASLTSRLLAVIAQPVTLEAGQQVSVGVSIGVVTAAPHDDANTLLRDGDAALYRAKDRGRGRAEHFDDELRVEALERRELPQELRAALARTDELFCLYQPEIEVASGRLFSFEALVRWRHPQRGLLPPDRFVPLAENAGLAGALFDHVLEETLTTQQRWATQLGFSPAVSVNLSARQLHDAALPATVAAALTRSGVPAAQLWLEVTEGAIADASSYETLAALHGLGVRLAIDDFGTGWSSMARLADSPWDLLKIDRSFIARLCTDPRAEHVVRAMVVMAHALGIRTVAEGVETRAQLEILAAMDCDIVQGYLFARPLDARTAVVDLAEDGVWTGAGGQARRPAAEAR